MELVEGVSELDDQRGTCNTENTGSVLGRLGTVSEGASWAVVEKMAEEFFPGR